MPRSVPRTAVTASAAVLLGLALPLGAAASPQLNPATTNTATVDTAATNTAAVDTATVDAPGDRAGFRHPGVLVTTTQLDLVKTKLADGAEPWTTAYDQMATSDYASLSYAAHPWEVIECGSNSDPNYGCTDERNDAIAAYTHALRWYLTGDSRYADKSIQIMDAWSGMLTDHINSNAPLQTGWSGASWSRAAELIRYTYDGWPANRIDRFERMLRDVYLPELVNGAPNKNGNWELIMTDAMIGIAVFLDDRETFDQAIEIWRCRVPAYFYLESDGAYPKPPCGGDQDTPEELIEYWHGQTTFVDGLSQETCRRIGYVGWGVEGATHIAETAWIQGVDLYAEVRPRMTKSLEFHAKYDLGADVPDWLCGGTVSPGLGPTLEVAYNHYRNRAGASLPRTLEVIRANRPMGANYFLAWETLTHAGNP